MLHGLIGWPSNEVVRQRHHSLCAQCHTQSTPTYCTPIKWRDIQGPDRIYNRKTALLKKNVTKANMDETWRENGVDREQ